MIRIVLVGVTTVEVVEKMGSAALRRRLVTIVGEVGVKRTVNALAALLLAVHHHHQVRRADPAPVRLKAVAAAAAGVAPRAALHHAAVVIERSGERNHVTVSFMS